jgi:transcriptional regulator with XRE-family HTH domain
MKTKQPVSFDDVFTALEQDEEFRKADRQLKPYYDLVLAIIRRRNELGLTQKDLAERANTYQSRISKIESAEHDSRLSTLIQIAEALDAEISIRLVPIEKPISVASDEGAYNLCKEVSSFRGVAAQTYSVSELDEYPVTTIFP